MNFIPPRFAFLLLVAALCSTPVNAQTSLTRIDLGQQSNVLGVLSSNGFDTEHDVVNGAPSGSIDLLVPDSDLPRLAALGLSYVVVQHSTSLTDSIGLTDAPAAQFYDWVELNAEMTALAAQYPAIAMKVSLTTLTGSPLTHEGRHIYALKISDNVAADEDEPNLLYVGNHHAREIATPAHMVQWMRDLCAEYTTDPAITSAINGNEIWIVPTLNPDGLEYVWSTDEWWRKNRRNNGGNSWGVDLNRNYPYDWASCGSYSHSSTSDVYVGPYAASEPETQTLMALARARHFAKVIDIHQSGREVLYPYTCGNMPIAAFQKVTAMRDALASAANYAHRFASAGGEHFEWEFNEIGAMSFLIELNTSFSPTWSSFQSEYARVKPAYRTMLFESLPVSGHIYDAETGAPIDNASVDIASVNWLENETRQSGGGFGRFQSWLVDGSYTMAVGASGYVPQNLAVNMSSAGEVRDVFLAPNNVPSLSTIGLPTAGQSMQFTVMNAGAHIGATAYILLSKTGGGPFSAGTPIAGGFTLPILQDPVTSWSQSQSALRPTVMASGMAFSSSLSVPVSAAGWNIWGSAVFVQGGVQAVTPAHYFQVQ
jgi:hypothetical protein